MTIDGIKGDWTSIGIKYDYKADPCKCGYCGGMGMPWAGWMHCHDCGALNLVESGETFVSPTMRLA